MTAEDGKRVGTTPVINTPTLRRAKQLLSLRVMPPMLAEQKQVRTISATLFPTATNEAFDDEFLDVWTSESVVLNRS